MEGTDGMVSEARQAARDAIAAAGAKREEIEGSKKGRKAKSTAAKAHRAKATGTDGAVFVPPPKRVDESAVAAPVPSDLPAGEHELASLRRIARATMLVEQVEGDLALARREWNEIVAKRIAARKGLIEASGGMEADAAPARLNEILMAEQEVQEADAGRKVALADVLTRKKRARKLLRESFDNAKQTDLFDGRQSGDGAGVDSVEAMEADPPASPLMPD